MLQKMIYYSSLFLVVYFALGQQHTDGLIHVQLWISTIVPCIMGSYFFFLKIYRWKDIMKYVSNYFPNYAS